MARLLFHLLNASISSSRRPFRGLTAVFGESRGDPSTPRRMRLDARGLSKWA